MTQSRAREVRSPEGSWPPCRQSLAMLRLQGGASDLHTGPQVWGLQCTPSS